MGNPTGERQKSEAAEQVITSRADIAFQVNNIKNSNFMVSISFVSQKMDMDQDGVITLEDFLAYYRDDIKMTQSIDVLKIIPIQIEEY